ncbi:VCBS repeat-containing protein [Hwangdonia lutea]|uniref:VCBS repeat-containing protein n=1 Tax=Hwangdonia lutea TaxID=3075823 RepID=A0AA97HRK9_9FLAO|nr:VCBS repeat-containing protein [Hwangdonia sp. SCSIO 19198]WOD44160.1 VCBS repeat-containing protein [Hwangdonia sp. SCSIO 19198]
MIKAHQYIKLVIVFLSMFIVSCKKESDKKTHQLENASVTLFTEISPNESGLNFINEIPESSAMNSMVYEYFYNGGGVAVGDINNDGLPDIYFTSNLKDNKLYLNKGDFKFEDITDKAKVKGSFGWTTGVTMVDINADGWLDIYVCKSGKGKAKNRQNELFVNNKNGTFTEAAATYGLNFSGYSTQAAFFDFDKDGDLDMFLLNHNVTPINTNNPENYKTKEDEFVGDKLYRNDSGKFTDISKRAGIIGNPLGFGLGVSVGDLNQDGWPDIYVANDYIEHDYLYYNNGDGTFSESLKSSIKHIPNFSMGTDIADFNNDGLLDIMSLDMVAEDNYGIKTSMSGMNLDIFNHAVNHGFHYQYMFNALQMNIGNRNFSEIAQLAGVSNTDWSWSPLFADFDNDGYKDLFVSNGLKRDFRNNDFRNHKLKRLKQAQKNKEKMAPVIEELVSQTPQRKTPNYFFKNNGDLTFTKASTHWGISKPTFSNGAAYADFDNDGDLDLVVNNIDEPATILKNNSNKNYLQFQFKGNPKNPFGIGVRVEAKTKNGTQYLENYPTRGYQSAVEPILHFGLNDLKSVESIKIIWPNNKVQTLKDITANQRLTIHYTDSKLKENRNDKLNPTLFKDITKASKIKHKHIENDYNDFINESLLPHKMSQFGPAVAVADINNDGLDDFFIGGSKGHSGTLYIQNNGGVFKVSNAKTWKNDKSYEDVDAHFFDADNDGDLDLYVVSGGNEWKANSNMYQDRLYINTHGNFKKANANLPKMYSSGGCVKPFDFDGDGDLDLFIGSRLKAQTYPFSGTSYLLENTNGKFKDITPQRASELSNIGMVTDAIWTDFDNDNQTDLIVVGEWMAISFFKNENGNFILQENMLPNSSGWWNSIKGADFDNDGDTDYIVGNLGLNYKYKASVKEPFEVFSTDFDDNGTNDIVLGYYNNQDLFPLRGRECSSNQMPFIKKKFPTYDAFGSAKLIDVYGKEKLEKALHLKANTFASVYLENLGNGQFNMVALPHEAQVSSINDILIDDFNKDGFKDILVAGNMYQSEIETTRNDASYGLLLLHNGKNNFKPISALESGIGIKGMVKDLSIIKQKDSKSILVTINNDSMVVYKWNTP